MGFGQASVGRYHLVDSKKITMKPYSRVRYLLLAFYYKIRIPFDCSEGRLLLLYSELLHYIDALCHTWWEMPRFETVRTIKTLWGRFYFYGDLYSYLIMNPSFERADMEWLASYIKDGLGVHKRMLFLDIGANVGLYSVGLSTRLGKHALTIHAFEPEPRYFALLKKNITMNAVPHVVLHNIALGDKNMTVTSKEFLWPGHTIPTNEVKFTMRTLDDVLKLDYVSKFDQIIVKMDIEGHEEEALRGARAFARIKKPILLMIEDSVKPRVHKYLVSRGFTFVGRVSPYNSFWTLN